MPNTARMNEHFEQQPQPLAAAIANSWEKIAPSWPLKSLIAVNPLAGFGGLPFEEALKAGRAYFQQTELPNEMQEVNRESIKWLQIYFDEGQATIKMPGRSQHFLQSVLNLLQYDTRVNIQSYKWIKKSSNNAQSLILEALNYLNIHQNDHETFLTLMLSTLPGWAAYIKFKTAWEKDKVDTALQDQYLVFRLVLTCLLYPQAKLLLKWHERAGSNSNTSKQYSKISVEEQRYQQQLHSKLKVAKKSGAIKRSQAQMVFCIDVRSEPFRRAIEVQGNYETLGFAGFFGIPMAVKNQLTGASHASCPVLLKPGHEITESAVGNPSYTRTYSRKITFKSIYQSLKYTFTTPFNLVEMLGAGSGVWMALKSLFPKISGRIKNLLEKEIKRPFALKTDISSIPLAQQIGYGKNALNMMGLTTNFAPLVLLCGHSSTTENNAYETALDCGACGGHRGAPNAQVLASILNAAKVRAALQKEGISIPKDTYFLAAEHNTTTDELVLDEQNVPRSHKQKTIKLKDDIQKAQALNLQKRAEKLDPNTSPAKTLHRANDWAQVRPEWGLARNASFIVGPRWLTKNADLEGRSFLHSYEWEQDKDLSSLTTILTAPMVVAQWINAQYLFSTMDNVAFGSGSKITQNIIGKFGVMQGNGSDLMHGLPLQSVYKSDNDPYHQPLRLTVVVYAPKTHIDPIIKAQPILQKLFKNSWVHLICIDPLQNKSFALQRTLMWGGGGAACLR